MLLSDWLDDKAFHDLSRRFSPTRLWQGGERYPMGRSSSAAHKLFLVGFMGCGKTTLGRLAAARLGGRFFDLDERIVAAAGRPIRDIFQLEGEAGFRRRESDLLRRLCAEEQRDRRWSVIALGGGAFASPENRACIAQSGCSLWLDVPFEVLAARVARDGSRPLWSSLEDARSRYQLRRSDYAQADIHLAVGNATPQEAASRIIRALAAWHFAHKSLDRSPADDA
ncbi:MAG: shikimate kinase [Chloracidobacterium sp. CP2_5A]|nr:MAG: shikimate kinase [Chloracidobacterium sp. CP2_5A]